MITSVRKIAVLRALYLGDLLCSVPALRALRQRFPAAQISLIGLPWASEFVCHCPYVDRLLVFPGYQGITEVPYQPERTAAFLSTARTAEYDLAIQMHGDGNISNGFVAGLSAGTTLGYHRLDEDQRLTFSLPYQAEEHEIRRWLRLGQLLGAGVDDERLEWSISAAETAAAKSLLPVTDPRRPIVALHMGAKDPARRWPVTSFARLGDELSRHWNARIVLTGNRDERQLADELQFAMAYPSANLCGLTDLGTFAATIAHLDLLVTNDTGASHLAAATHTRSVVLFGPTRPAQWAPLDQETHQVIDALVEVDPLDGASALQRLPVERVVRACAELLRGQRQGVACVV